MNITAKITGIEYKIKIASKLNSFELTDFDINNLPANCILKDKNYLFGLSKWVSPKRTISYHYARIYNTLNISKRITVIPIIKDEGKEGDRDFIQWDTVSLMSLLDVFVIFAYYNNAEKHSSRENKITNQKFNNKYVNDKIIEIKKYHSSALHWNLREIKRTFPKLISKAKSSYRKISNKLDVEFHSEKGINNFASKFLSGVTEFMNSSRQKAKEAQKREISTVQPKERLRTDSKATITIKNYLGGEYYFTTDEVEICKNKIYLIEDKHTKSAKLPSEGDIKDGLLKMILYTNLEKVYVNNKEYIPCPVLNLTSTQLIGNISSNSFSIQIKRFVHTNSFTDKQTDLILSLIEEAEENNFILEINKFE